MALPLGTENKRQVYLLAVLGVVILVAGGWEIYNSLSGPSSSAPPPVAQVPALRAPVAQQDPASTGVDAQKLTNAAIDPSLHFAKLAESEDVQYAGTGRNIFSPDSAPVIPNPIISPRPNPGTTAVATPAPPPVPVAPPIDLKYFGYSQEPDKVFKAFFVRGEDIFMAHPGEIVDHRFKINNIRPLSVEVTDLAYNNTQTINITPQ
jgi:hypothetical protein